MNPRILEEGHTGCDSACCCDTGVGEVDLNSTKAQKDCDVANCPDLSFFCAFHICSRRQHFGGRCGVQSANFWHLLKLGCITQLSGVEICDSSQKCVFTASLVPRTHAEFWPNFQHITRAPDQETTILTPSLGTTDILCTVLWVPHRVVHTIRCFQLL